MADGGDKRGLTDPELLNLIRQYEQASLGSSVAAGATISTTLVPNQQAMTTLEIDRFNALNTYFARPLGNEVENRSQVVDPVLRDTIEWIMPQLMRMFVSAKTVCRFDAVNPNDEDQAAHETAVVNHVFMQENNGVFLLHDFFKDALLMRNGYAKMNWKEEKRVSEERYTGLDQMGLVSILQDKNTEVVDQNERQVQILQEGMPPQTISVFDIRIRRTVVEGREHIEAIPPEEMRVSPRARRGMGNIPFAAHVTTSTRSDLIADGFDRDLVDSMAAGRPNWMEMDALARDQVVDQLSIENPSDRAMQEIELRDCVIMVDFDGDGIAELRHVLVGGDKILENEVIEETIFASGVPVRMPHRHTGISVYDLVADLQIIKTTLWRQGLDNLTISNNQRIAVDYTLCNLDDLLTSRPAGVVRGRGPPASWIQAIEHPSNIVQQVLPVLQYMDEQRSERTGIGKGTMGLDADDLQNVTKGAQLAAMSAASLKIELMARMLAEGVKDIFLTIHAHLCRHQNQPMQLEIAGKWVEVDPTQWRRRTKVSVNVGLGSGNREEMRASIQILAQAMGAMAQSGMVGPKQQYAAFKVLCESLGFTNPEQFAMDPMSPEFKQHQQQMQAAQANAPQAPQIQAAKIKAQTTLLQEQAENQRAQTEAQVDLTKAREQMVHQHLQNEQDRMHEQGQGHKDREVQLDANHMALISTVIKALSPIIAGQLKGDPGANAGAVLAQDTQSADAGIEGGAPNVNDRMAAALENLHGAISHMNRPKVATLSDGRQIRIE